MSAVLVAPEPLAADAGAAIFRAGGSAIDAAIGTAFAQGVVNPFLCGLGGSALILHMDLRTGKSTVVNGESATGSGLVPDHWVSEYRGRQETFGRHAIASEENQIGAASVMVPGLVDALHALHGLGGVLPESDLLEPAIALASDGFIVYPYVAQFWELGGAGDSHSARPAYPSLAEKMRREPRTAERYLHSDGRGYAAGERFPQPWIADVLRHLQRAGLDDFLHGELGAALAAGLAADGSLVRPVDVDSYAAVTGEGIAHTIDGFGVFSTPPPSPGLQVIQMLAIARDLGLDPLARDAASVSRRAKVMRASFADNRYIKATKEQDAHATTAMILSDDAIASWVSRISSGDPVIVSGDAPADGTTHVTAVDDNHAVCITHSLGSAAGSGYVVDELGFLLNNFLGHYDPRPGQRDSIRAGARIGTGAPLIALDSQGAFRAAVGAPGGSRLITADFQVAGDILFGGDEADTAVARPRIHSEEDRMVFVEPGVSPDVVAQMQNLGDSVQESTYMSRVQAVSRTAEGELVAGSDPRGGVGIARG